MSQYIINAGLQFNVSAASVKPAVDILQSQLKQHPLDVPVNLKITNATANQVKGQINKINALSTALGRLSETSKHASTNLDTVAKSLRRVGVAVGVATSGNKQLGSTVTQL